MKPKQKSVNDTMTPPTKDKQGPPKRMIGPACPKRLFIYIIPTMITMLSNHHDMDRRTQVHVFLCLRVVAVFLFNPNRAAP